MVNPAKHTDPFDSLDDLDDEFIDYKARLDAEDDYGSQAAPQRVDETVSDPFADDDFDTAEAFEPEMAMQRQAFAAPAAAAPPLGLHNLAEDEDIGAVSIPRITIHFFPESEASLAACDTASLDRRMARAQCIVRRGGISEAIDTYRHEPTPSLIFVESGSRGRDLLDQLGQLAEVCDANTKVVVIGAHNDISLYRELIRQGVSEYMVLPVQPLQLIKTTAGLFDDPETPFVGRTIAFVGARGGAGSSSIAHNFAYNLSEQMQSNTVIVDYDLPFGTAGLDFNQDPLHGMADALNEPDRLDNVLLDRMLTKCTERLSLFSAPATLDQDYTADQETYEEVTRKIRSAAPYIVMDLPHVWTPWLKSNLISADEVIIVATPDLASLRNAKNIIDLLKQYRPNDTPPRLVLNQMDMPGRPEIPVKDFTAALGVEPAVLIPFDAKLFGQASNNGQMIAECGPASKVADSLMQLTSKVTGRNPEPKTKKSSSFLANLFKK
ncbi:AAA family ATPase [Asticcacaulis sp. 201]|uniref:AAA family ATPase n=1 Tax=Asticcacaulis sp. 201 TaxID=3028787 RepID=UPI002916AE89|nr:AAA family ATPase [Asticcacaulis sp. 201]MDV6332077.1 AAA family ATPase [Asticcacaulis sp. 201]